MIKFLIASMLLFGIYSTNVFAHGDGDPRVSLEAEQQANLQAGDEIHFGFQLFDETAKKAVSDQDLLLTHTMKVHLIVYDASLREFSHVHPEFDGSVWQTELNLHVNGSYFIWAQGQLNDGTEFSASYRTRVEGGLPAWPVNALGDHRKASDGLTAVQLKNTKIIAGKTVMIDYEVTRTDGTEPEITPYLGADAHIIAVSPDGDELIHVHPMAGGSSSLGMIHAVFPTDGDYRVWVQLIDHGVLKTIPLSVTVLK